MAAPTNSVQSVKCT